MSFFGKADIIKLLLSFLHYISYITTMTDEQAVEAEVVQQPEKKKKGPLFWVSIIGCGCLLLLCCGCSAAFALIATSEDFQDQYCDTWEEQGYDLDQEPFGFCD